MHMVLLGDSIFDNAPYVNEGDTVSEQLSAMATTADVTLLAIDGDVTAGVRSQLAGLPTTATHLFVSCGGNDALSALPLLGESVNNVTEALELMDRVTATFRQDYRAMLESVMDKRIELAVCTIYNCVPGLPDAEVRALALFNEIILEEAIRMGLPVIDLRVICDEESDYSLVSPIEPSAAGGRKIAERILAVASGCANHSTINVVY